MAVTSAVHNMHYRVKGVAYSRDLDNMAILCEDKSEIVRYNNEMKKIQENRVRDMEINNLKTDIAEIKALLKQIIERG